jgi:hypothetical protein
LIDFGNEPMAVLLTEKSEVFQGLRIACNRGQLQIPALAVVQKNLAGISYGHHRLTGVLRVKHFAKPDLGTRPIASTH